MNDAEIRATLRGSCRDGIIRGWQSHLKGYTVNGFRVCHDIDAADAIDYCEFLQTIGVAPLPKPWDHRDRRDHNNEL